MANLKLAKALTRELPSGCKASRLFNPYSDRCDEDEPCNGPEAKLERLAAHLDCDPEFILCGEAPSHRGCRYSGIAFTSEFLLQRGCIPRIPAFTHRLTRYKEDPYKERSATIVWRALHKLKIADRTILWNALPLHPYESEENQHSNRTPKDEEFEIGEGALSEICRAFPSARLIAVGKKAEGRIQLMGIESAGSVPHPASRGRGTPSFGQALESLVRGGSERIFQ